VNERELRSKRVKIRAHARDVLQRLPAKRSTEVSKKNQQQRAAV